MARENTVGSFMLKSFLVLGAFNMIYVVLKMFVDYYNNYVSFITQTFGTGWLFSPVVEFLLGLWGWMRLLFIDMTALAVLFFISMTEEAYSTKWKK